MSMEVFTISGAALGYDALDYTRELDRKRAAAAHGTVPTSFASTSSATPPVALQNALKALGAAHGDGSLNIAVDGVIGPGTVRATNYALATYIGAGPLQAAGLTGRFLNATAVKSDVQKYAGTLAQIVTNSVKSAGGTIPDPVVSHSSRGSSKVAAAAQQAMTNDPSNPHPNMVYYIAGGALIVVALGFMAARKRAA